MCSTFWALTRLSFPEERERSLGNTLPSPIHNATLDPDDHLLCYDYLYYACAQQVRPHLEDSGRDANGHNSLSSTNTTMPQCGDTSCDTCGGRSASS